MRPPRQQNPWSPRGKAYVDLGVEKGGRRLGRHERLCLADGVDVGLQELSTPLARLILEPAKDLLGRKLDAEPGDKDRRQHLELRTARREKRAKTEAS